MGILKKYFEFKQETGGEEIISKIESPTSPELKELLDELKTKFEDKKNAEVEYNGYKISLPSELNGVGQDLTYLVINTEGKHAQAQSEEDVEKVVTEQVLFESLRSKRKRK